MSSAAQIVGRLTASLNHLLKAIARPTLWPVLPSIAAAFLIGQYFWGWFRLRHIKGPLWASVTDLWLIRKTWRGETFEELSRVCEAYGELLHYLAACPYSGPYFCQQLLSRPRRAHRAQLCRLWRPHRGSPHVGGAVAV